MKWTKDVFYRSGYHCQYSRGWFGSPKSTEKHLSSALGMKRSLCWTRNTTHRLIGFCSATIRIFTPREQAKNPKAKRKLKKDTIWGTLLKIYSVFIGEAAFSCWELWLDISKLWTWVVCFVNRAALIRRISFSPLFFLLTHIWTFLLFKSSVVPWYCTAKMTVATSHLLSEAENKAKNSQSEWGHKAHLANFARRLLHRTGGFT